MAIRESFSEMLRYLWKIMYVQVCAALRVICTVTDGPLKSLLAFWVWELPRITLYYYENYEWKFTLTRGVCSWDWMSSQEVGCNRISIRQVEWVRKEKVWKCMESSLLEICVLPILHYSCEKQFFWYSLFRSTWEVFVKCMAEVSHIALQVFYMQNCNVLAYYCCMFCTAVFFCQEYVQSEQ